MATDAQVTTEESIIGLKNQLSEHLAVSVSNTCDSWAWGCEFEPHFGCRDYLV